MCAIANAACFRLMYCPLGAVMNQPLADAKFKLQSKCFAKTHCKYYIILQRYVNFQLITSPEGAQIKFLYKIYYHK